MTTGNNQQAESSSSLSYIVKFVIGLGLVYFYKQQMCCDGTHHHHHHHHDMTMETIFACIYSFFDKDVCFGAADIEREDKEKFVKTFKLSEQEDREILRTYFKKEEEIRPTEDCAIGVGYNACTDISFNVVDLFKVLDPEIRKMEQDEKIEIKPQVHDEIRTLRQLVETFTFQFMNGANAERVSHSKEVFRHIISTIKSNGLYHREEIGGHSPVWALRGQTEGCKMFVATQSTKVIDTQLKLSEEASKKHLLWPQDRI